MQWSSKIFSVLGSHINKMLIVPLIEYSLELKTTSVKEDSNIEGRQNDQDSGTITRYSDNLNSNSSSFQSYPTNIMSSGFSGSQFQSDSTTFVDGFVRSEES